MIVIVTIHGIGFQNSPSALDASDGYADALHAGLCQQPALSGGVLGHDPNRIAAKGSGPVYVSSTFPPESQNIDGGLSRLGVWTDSGIDPQGTQLAPPDAAYAHVALVYSHLEETHGDAVATAGIGVLGGASLNHYATVGGLLKMAFDDLRVAGAKPQAGTAPASTPSLRVRPHPAGHQSFFNKLLQHFPHPGGGGGPFETLHQVEDDVAAYVVRNEHRERVRAFIRDAVSRILGRDEVKGVVINGHSNGCVMAFDLIAALSPPSARQVRLLITAGCPLRKYVDFLDWGTDARNMSDMPGPWTNFYDDEDPVADPMQPPEGWKRGRTPPPGGGPGLFVKYDAQGEESSVAVTDERIKNVGVCGGALPAHNYWDNPAFWEKAAALIVKSRP